MDNSYENIIPWDGEKDTGQDVRLKLERNFKRIGLNFQELEGKFSTADEFFELIAQELEKKLSKTEDDMASGLITFLQGLVAKGVINAEEGLKIGQFVAGIAGGNFDAVGNAELNSLIVRLKAVVQSLDVSDHAKTKTLSVLEKLAAKTATFSSDISSKDYVMNLLGWLITPTGDINANSLRLRDFLEVPEFRYNRISVVSGERWNAPGGGLIESVDEENRILYLKLEPGEVANIMLDDICKASFNNSTGFQTAYFRIAEQLGESTFKYVLRNGYSFHPCKAMNIVAYGNFTNEDRQKSCYSAQNYIRFLKDVNSWEITKDMIAMQLGDLSNLKLFGIDMTGHSAYLRYIYMTGVIKQISDDGVTESRVPCFKGEWAEGAYYYYDEVTHNGSTWLCISEKPTIQEPMEDTADWLEKSAVGKDAVVINIMSSNGNVFQNGSVSTTLTAYVIKGDRDITDSIPASRFSWEKESNNKDTDKIFNETHVGHGHVLTLTSDDVWGRATFNCIVSL